jgi:hypothetical protein
MVGSMVYLAGRMIYDDQYDTWSAGGAFMTGKMVCGRNLQ